MIPRLASWCFRRRRIALVLWIVLAVGVVTIGTIAKGEYRADYAAPGSDSKVAQDILEANNSDRSGDPIDIIYKVEGGVDNAAFQVQLKAFENQLVALIVSADAKGSLLKDADGNVPAEPTASIQEPQISEDGTVGIESVLTNFDANDPPIKLGQEIIALQEEFKEKLPEGAVIELSGQIPATGEQEPAESEAFGFGAAMIILFIAFGSLLAMGIPIGIAALSLTVATALIGLLEHVVSVPNWAPIIASLIGIGVGIDYALFIVARYRNALGNGKKPSEAVVIAYNTAGRAVVFAGCIVVVALLGLTVMKLGYLYGVAFSASIAVLVVMISAITLLPAILGFARYKINGVLVQNPDAGARSKKVGNFFYKVTLVFPIIAKLTKGKRGVRKSHTQPSKHNRPDDPNSFWHRWSHGIQHHPWRAVVGSLAVLFILTLPVLDLNLGFPDASNEPKTYTTHRAFMIQRETLGPGSSAPIYVVVETKGATQQELSALFGAVQSAEGIEQAVPAQLQAGQKTAMIIAQPTTSPQDETTKSTLTNLRDDVIPEAIEGTDMEVHLGGLTASYIDSSQYIEDRLPQFIGAVVLLSFLLLMVVFRSILVPLKAAIMNLLSISAAYGVMAYAVNGSWLGDLIGITEPTPVPSFVPMIMFAILFGLSMDYEVFLLTRIREEYNKTGDNKTAVADGLAATARVITAAAAIMVAVFSAFMLDPNSFVKAIGLGLATAILVDATIIRLLLVPATMELLGKANWWYPKWLDRITPHINIDAEDVVDLNEPSKEPELASVD